MGFNSAFKVLSDCDYRKIKLLEFVFCSFCFDNDHVNACNVLRVGVVWGVAVRCNPE